MNSALYTGLVSHSRLRPKQHSLRYRIFMLLLDLDEIERLDQSLRVFSHNGLNLLGFRDRDHGDRARRPLKPQIIARLRQEGIELVGGRIQLLCMPRVLGHGFNPLSVYFCRRPDGELAAILYEVNNTFGERHEYLIKVAAGSSEGRIRQGCDKAFYVSPFLPMDLVYAFDILPPGERVSVGMQVSDAEGLVLAASYAAERQPLTDGALLKAMVTHPWQILGVMAAIHWEAAKILLKGFRFFSNPRRSKPAAASGSDPVVT